jgi:hypothetical protein
MTYQDTEFVAPQIAVNVEYLPEMWTVRKDHIYDAIYSLDRGLLYAEQYLAEHHASKLITESTEKDINQIKTILTKLKRLP